MIIIPPKKETPERQVEVLAVNGDDAAKMLSVCKRTVCTLAKQGKITCKKVGTRNIFTVASIRAFLDARDGEN